MASALTRTTFKHSSKLNMPEKQIALYLVQATRAAQGWLTLHQFCRNGIALKKDSLKEMPRSSPMKPSKKTNSPLLVGSVSAEFCHIYSTVN